MKQLPSQIITRGLLIVVCWLWGMGASHSYAQNLTVESITEHANDVIGRADTRLDLNDEPCALLKFSMPAPITKVAGNYIGEPVRKNNEQWVYITNGANRIDITAEGYLPLSINFPQYGIRRVKGGIVYRIKLKEEVEGEDWTAEELYGMAQAYIEQKEYQKGVTWLRQASEKGSLGALHTLGTLYARGYGVEKNEKKAFLYFKKAADADYVPSLPLVAYSYLEGRGVPIDTTQAISYLNKAMEKGDAAAYGKMATLFEEGKGVEKDERKAFELMTLSANKGDKMSLFYLAKYNELGIGTEPDHQTALRILRKAKAEGVVEASTMLNRLSEEEYKKQYSSQTELFLEIFNQLANNPEDNYSELEQPYNIRFIDKAVSGYYMEHTFDYLFNHFSYASFHPREFYWKGYFIMHDDSTHEILKDKRTNSEFFSLRPQPQRSPSGKKYAIIGRSPKLFSYAVFLVNGSSGTEQVIDLAQIKTDQMLKKDLQAVSWLNDNTLCFYSSHGTFKYSIWNGEIQQMKDVEGYVLPSADGETLYWEDFDGSVWKRSVNESAKQFVTSNAFDITLWGDELYFRRNSSDGISEIYRLNVKTYKEEKVLSSKEHGFSSPQVSPDGQYLAVTGNATSPISKKENLDIFVCRTDGSQLRQLTDHPGSDQCPVWSADGTRIFFLSERRTDGTKWSEGNAGWLYRMDLKLNK